MNRIIWVDLEDQEVEVRKVESIKRKKAADQYDIADPFFQEDEDKGTDVLACEYQHFFCLAGESVQGLEKKKEELGGETKNKKEKRESTRQGFMDDKEVLLASLSERPLADLPEQARQLLVLEILTAQEPSLSGLLADVRESQSKQKDQNGVALMSKERLAMIEAELTRIFTEEYLVAIGETTKTESAELLDIIKGIIAAQKAEIDLKEPNDPTEAKYAKLVFDDSFIELLSQYTDKEYLLFYLNLYLSNKKRVLEYTVKKAIFQQLQELFPSTYGSVGSIGKKISSYNLKRKNKKAAATTTSTTPGNTKSSPTKPTTSKTQTSTKSATPNNTDSLPATNSSATNSVSTNSTATTDNNTDALPTTLSNPQTTLSDSPTTANPQTTLSNPIQTNTNSIQTTTNSDDEPITTPSTPTLPTPTLPPTSSPYHSTPSRPNSPPSNPTPSSAPMSHERDVPLHQLLSSLDDPTLSSEESDLEGANTKRVKLEDNDEEDEEDEEKDGAGGSDSGLGDTQQYETLDLNE
ncbi:hypothetical protein NEHOM01_0068 [Nematocida homosporus]|uniref:uncharacterized protein n=1 Tax=Nematocida homosporus TaxID=1912981 RepID=UPI002221100F|nr:uncharacterized protein NEHOM01_0068 [Nematocida homosporus]KAI5184323.1 hypothetical protein NEHOM01_0068 [Nematocida homosporus]